MAKVSRVSAPNSMAKAAIQAQTEELRREILLWEIGEEVRRKESPDLASLIGAFVVYTQDLELSLKRLLTLVYSFKSYFNNQGYSIMRPGEGHMPKDGLGRLIAQTSKLRLRNEATKEDELRDWIQKLNSFKEKRNNYIHCLLTEQDLSDLPKLKKDLLAANLELVELIEESRKKIEILNRVFEIDGMPSFVRHVMSEKPVKSGAKN